jgi:K+-transporting ATPase ATPase C chain
VRPPVQRHAIDYWGALALVTGVIYPLVSGGFAQVLFPAQANGSILRRSDGSAIGSSLIGQQFVAPGSEESG